MPGNLPNVIGDCGPVSALAATVAAMSNSAHWAVSAGNKFREVARTTENPTTKLLAEGLTHLSEAVRELHQELGTT